MQRHHQSQLQHLHANCKLLLQHCSTILESSKLVHPDIHPSELSTDHSSNLQLSTAANGITVQCNELAMLCKDVRRALLTTDNQRVTEMKVDKRQHILAESSSTDLDIQELQQLLL
ncbi:hypothetical protein P9112_004386 [Eukaryota sp. TZLM1-RC]